MKDNSYIDLPIMRIEKNPFSFIQLANVTISLNNWTTVH